jgi:hypothetical protein
MKEDFEKIIFWQRGAAGEGGYEIVVSKKQ